MAPVDAGLGVGDPPLVVVEPAVLLRIGPRVGRHQARVARPQPPYPLARQHAAAVDLALLQEEQAEQGEVVQRDAEAPVGEGEPTRPDDEVAFVRGAERLPDVLGEELCHRPAGRALQTPAEDVGADRAVLELGAVLGLPAQPRDVLGRRGVVGQACEPAQRSEPTPGLGVHVVVVALVERDAGGHVEEVLGGAAFPDRAGQLVDVVGDERLRVEATRRRERAGEGGGHRLGDRLAQVPRRGRHAAGIVLEDDGAVVDHHAALDVGLFHRRGQGPLTPGVVEAEGGEVARTPGQDRRHVASRHPRGRQELPRV